MTRCARWARQRSPRCRSRRSGSCAPWAKSRVSASEAFEQAAPAENLVLDSLRPQRMPDRGDVDRNHRLAQLLLQRREDVLRGKISARLHDRIDIVSVELVKHHIDHLA